MISCGSFLSSFFVHKNEYPAICEESSGKIILKDGFFCFVLFPSIKFTGFIDGGRTDLSGERIVIRLFFCQTKLKLSSIIKGFTNIFEFLSEISFVSSQYSPVFLAKYID